MGKLRFNKKPAVSKMEIVQTKKIPTLAKFGDSECEEIMYKKNH